MRAYLPTATQELKAQQIADDLRRKPHRSNLLRGIEIHEGPQSAGIKIS
jgi:hypothetical protein